MDIKIDQTALVQQILGSNPGKQIVFINMANTVHEAQGIQGDTLWDIIRNLPEPRMESLKQLAIEECYKHIGNKTASASFMGLSFRSVRGRLNKKTVVDAEVVPEEPLRLNP